MKITPVYFGSIHCDGGATFGVVPKVAWNKHYPCDDDNFCALTLRSLIIDNGSRRILVDTGAGEKQSAHFRTLNRVVSNGSAAEQVRLAGYDPDSITDVLFTHLHFDHCGGAIEPGSDALPAFRNATHWCAAAQWENFLKPNIREGSVYFAENLLPLQQRGILKLIDREGPWADGVELRAFHGHTAGLLLPLIATSTGKIWYTGDCIPLAAHIPIAWVSAYDTLPAQSMAEKAQMLDEACENGYRLLFQHDVYTEACSLVRTAKGIVMNEKLKVEQL